MLGSVTITGGSPGTNTKLPVTFAVLAIVPFDGALTTVTWKMTSTLSPGFISGSRNPLFGLNQVVTQIYRYSVRHECYRGR